MVPLVVPAVGCVSKSTVNKYLNLLVREMMKLQLMLWQHYAVASARFSTASS